MRGVLENFCPSNRKQKQFKLIHIKNACKGCFCFLTLWLVDLSLNSISCFLSLCQLWSLVANLVLVYLVLCSLNDLFDANKLSQDFAKKGGT